MAQIAQLKLIWSELNAAHFEGKLSPVPIRITRSRRTYGYFNAPSNGGQASIRISKVLADTDSLVRDTMLHEMIHQALYESGADDWDQHGDAFQIIHCEIFGFLYIEET